MKTSFATLVTSPVRFSASTKVQLFDCHVKAEHKGEAMHEPAHSISVLLITWGVKITNCNKR
jgi:hypothetical protein